MFIFNVPLLIFWILQRQTSRLQFLNNVLIKLRLSPLNLIQPTISLEMPVPSQGHYGFYSFPVVDWFIYLWVLTFPLADCSEFGNFVITLIFNIYLKRHVIAKTLVTRRRMPSETTSPPAEVLHAYMCVVARLIKQHGLLIKWPRICSTCRKHVPVLSSFTTYYRVCN